MTHFSFGAASQVRKFITATGGTVTTDGKYKVHKFTGNGTFVITDAPSSAAVEYLIVGGGGSGGGGAYTGSGSNAGGGGGGAGGLLSGTMPISVGSYPAVVGGSLLS